MYLHCSNHFGPDKHCEVDHFQFTKCFLRKRDTFMLFISTRSVDILSMICPPLYVMGLQIFFQTLAAHFFFTFLNAFFLLSRQQLISIDFQIVWKSFSRLFESFTALCLIWQRSQWWIAQLKLQEFQEDVNWFSCHRKMNGSQRLFVAGGPSPGVSTLWGVTGCLRGCRSRKCLCYTKSDFLLIFDCFWLIRTYF